MSTYILRLRFFAPGLVLDTSEREIELSIPGLGLASLSPTHPDDILSSTSDYKLVVKGISSLGEAEAIGRRLKHAIRKSAVDFRLGFDVGKDWPTSHSAAEIKEQYLETTGSRLLDNVHGLVVYEEEVPTKFLIMRGTANALYSVDAVSDAWSLHYEEDLDLSEKEILALELYAGAQREPTSRSRLISLATVVEVLATRGDRSDLARQMIRGFISQISNSELESAEKSSLQKALEELEKVGIANACKRHVKDRLSKRAADEFYRIYGVRCDLVHAGVSERCSSLSEEVDRLEGIVRPILQALGVKKSGDVVLSDGGSS